jgi:hypothetical protein
MFEGLFQETPGYLNKKNNIVKLILFTAFFAQVFINFYEPFNSRHWVQGVSDLKYFAYSVLIILTGLMVIVISRIIMYHHYKKAKSLLIWHYLVWVLAEIIVMSLFFVLFILFVMKREDDPMSLLKDSISSTSLVLLLPYAISWLFFSWEDKKKKLEDLESNENEADPIKKGMIVFNDEKGELKLSVRSEQLLYLESADNYVKIHYLNKGKLTHYMLRNTLKNLEESMSNTTMIRCHRSFVVNFDKVKVLRKEKDGIYLALDDERVPDLPVSKTYSERIMAKFSQFSA